MPLAKVSNRMFSNRLPESHQKYSFAYQGISKLQYQCRFRTSTQDQKIVFPFPTFITGLRRIFCSLCRYSGKR